MANLLRGCLCVALCACALKSGLEIVLGAQPGVPKQPISLSKPSTISHHFMTQQIDRRHSCARPDDAASDWRTARFAAGHRNAGFDRACAAAEVGGLSDSPGKPRRTWPCLYTLNCDWKYPTAQTRQRRSEACRWRYHSAHVELHIALRCIVKPYDSS